MSPDKFEQGKTVQEFEKPPLLFLAKGDLFCKSAICSVQLYRITHGKALFAVVFHLIQPEPSVSERTFLKRLLDSRMVLQPGIVQIKGKVFSLLSHLHRAGLFGPSLHSLVFIEAVIAAGIGKKIEGGKSLPAHVCHRLVKKELSDTGSPASAAYSEKRQFSIIGGAAAQQLLIHFFGLPKKPESGPTFLRT